MIVIVYYFIAKYIYYSFTNGSYYVIWDNALCPNHLNSSAFLLFLYQKKCVSFCPAPLTKNPFINWKQYPKQLNSAFQLTCAVEHKGHCFATYDTYWVTPTYLIPVLFYAYMFPFTYQWCIANFRYHKGCDKARWQ